MLWKHWNISAQESGRWSTDVWIKHENDKTDSPGRLFARFYEDWHEEHAEIFVQAWEQERKNARANSR